MTVFLPPGTNRYCYKFLMHGTWYRGPTGETDKRKATAVEREVKGKAIQEQALYAHKRTGAQMTVLEAVDRYIEQRRAQPLRNVQVTHDLEWTLEKLLGWIGPKTLMRDVTIEVLRGAMNRRALEPKISSGKVYLKLDPVSGLRKPVPLSPRTINKMWRAFRSVYMMARDEWGVPVSPIPWKKLRLAEPGPRTREISFAEEEQLLSRLPDGYRQCLKFALLSGHRLTNFALLQWGEVDFDNRTVGVIQKGHRFHSITLTDDMVEILEGERGKHPSAVFTFVATRTWTCPKNGAHYTKGLRYPLTPQGFVTRYRAAARAIGANVIVHDARRTCGCRMLRESANLKLVQTHLGHADISTTAKYYAHIQPDVMLETLNAISAASKARKSRSLNEGRQK